jgi:hypothetical protein
LLSRTEGRSTLLSNQVGVPDLNEPSLQIQRNVRVVLGGLVEELRDERAPSPVR